MTAVVPEGFEPIANDGPFVERNGPFYARRRDDGTFDYGFASGVLHENPDKVLHGGLVYTFADHVVGHLIHNVIKRDCATISLTAEYLKGAVSGKWIDGQVEILRHSSSLAFVNTGVLCEGELLFQGSGVWKLFGPREQQ